MVLVGNNEDVAALIEDLNRKAEFHDVLAPERNATGILLRRAAAALTVVAELRAWEFSQRVDHSEFIHEEGEEGIPYPTTWRSREARDVAVILKRIFAPQSESERIDD